MISPISIFGGKGLFTQHLLPLIADHHVYCEAFGGGASLLFAKSPSKIEIYNDLDSTLVDFFRMLQNPDDFDQFYQKCQITPCSRELWYEFRDTWQAETDKIERIYKWFVVARQSFSRSFGSSWGYIATKSGGGHPRVFRNTVDRLPEVVNRLKDIQIDNRSWETVLERYDSPNTFFYLDPPYVLSTRKDGVYNHEMTDADHESLIAKIQTLEAKVMLSGYDNDIYSALPWSRTDIQTFCSATGCTRNTKLKGDGKLKKFQPRTESIWLNYNPPQLFIPFAT